MLRGPFNGQGMIFISQLRSLAWLVAGGSSAGFIDLFET